MFNLRKIIREHNKSFRDEATRASSDGVFLLLPILISFFLVCFAGAHLSYGLTLILAFSILTGLLLNMAIMLSGTFSGAYKQDNQTDTSKRKLVWALHFNVLYTSFISITTLAVLLLCEFSRVWDWEPIYTTILPPLYIQTPVSFVIYFLVFHFVMNLLLILKRVESLVSLQMESGSAN